MKDYLGGQVIKKFARLWSKTYSYLKDNNGEGKKAKGTKKSVIRGILNLEIIKNA